MNVVAVDGRLVSDVAHCPASTGTAPVVEVGVAVDGRNPISSRSRPGVRHLGGSRDAAAGGRNVRRSFNRLVLNRRWPPA
jgi:hypothetical protein